MFALMYDAVLPRAFAKKDDPWYSSVMRAYSLDLRERVLGALDEGTSREQVVTTFKVSLSTIKRWLARRHNRLPLAAPRPTGRTHTLSPSDLAVLLTRLQAAADASIAAHTQWWNDTHPEHTVSAKTIERAIARLGWTRKKRPSVLANATSSREQLSVSA
jgi:transposase